jgi:hypothetical protein
MQGHLRFFHFWVQSRATCITKTATPFAQRLWTPHTYDEILVELRRAVGVLPACSRRTPNGCESKAIMSLNNSKGKTNRQKSMLHFIFAIIMFNFFFI